MNKMLFLGLCILCGCRKGQTPDTLKWDTLYKIKVIETGQWMTVYKDSYSGVTLQIGPMDSCSLFGSLNYGFVKKRPIKKDKRSKQKTP